MHRELHVVAPRGPQPTPSTLNHDLACNYTLRFQGAGHQGSHFAASDPLNFPKLSPKPISHKPQTLNP